MDEQINQGTSLEVHCRFCGNVQREVSQCEARSDHYQVLVACAQCGNEFVAISRN